MKKIIINDNFVSILFKIDKYAVAREDCNFKKQISLLYERIFGASSFNVFQRCRGDALTLLVINAPP